MSISKLELHISFTDDNHMDFKIKLPDDQGLSVIRLTDNSVKKSDPWHF